MNFSVQKKFLLAVVLYQALTIITILRAYEISVADGLTDSLGCPPGSSIYINQSSYGCPAHYPCAVKRSCLLTDQALRRMRVKCQGLPSCNLVPSPEAFHTNSCVSGPNYLNVSWHCQNETKKVLQENEPYNISCTGKDVVVFKYIYWNGFTVENVPNEGNQTNLNNQTNHLNNQTNLNNQTSHLNNQTNHLNNQTNHLNNQTNHLNNQTNHLNNQTNHLNNQTGFLGNQTNNPSSVNESSQVLNFTVPLPSQIVYSFQTRCVGKTVCTLTASTSLLGDPYPGILSKKSLEFEFTCQPVNSGYMEWSSWTTCPEACGVPHYLTRKRQCQNSAADCSGFPSQTKDEPCYNKCQVTNITVCENQTANLTCPPGTFINFDHVFFGRKSVEPCRSNQNMSISCTSSETEVYNEVRAYEHCQMRGNCSLNASTSIFKDPCPGYSKYLNLVYTCTPVVERVFYDQDHAKIKCFDNKRLVVHTSVKYGLPGNCSDVKVPYISRICKTSECTVEPVSPEKLSIKKSPCANAKNRRLLFRYSCQPALAIYTMWTSWGQCEACGLHARSSRYRKLSKGDQVLLDSWHGGSHLSEHATCYLPCEDHNFFTCDSKVNITCPRYLNNPTVIEVRSAFYGRIRTDVCSISILGSNCTSLKTTKKSIMKKCQGRNYCIIDDLSSYLEDPCSGSKYFNMTYRCQPVYKFWRKENSKLVPSNLTCYDNMVIVTHNASWKASACPAQPDTFEKVKGWCDGNTCCRVYNSYGILGDPCPKTPKTFTMWYSCQTALGGLDSEWGPWSNCTECGLYPMKSRRKNCLSPVNETTGAHCPLIKEYANCNKPCPVKKVVIKGQTNDFNVILGKLLKVRWTMELGTNVSAVFNWGDSSNQTLLDGFQANATSHLDTEVAHHYTKEGEFTIKLFASNVINNETASQVVHVQVKLAGLNTSAPRFLVINELGYFMFTLEVISLAPPDVSWTLGDGTPIVENKNFSLNHSYDKPGNYSFKVNVRNRVSALSYSSIVVVQERIDHLHFSENTYKFPFKVPSAINLLWSNGSHMLIFINFGNNSSLWRYVTLKDNKIGGFSLSRTFSQVGVFDVCANASNRINNATACASVIVEIPVSGLESSVVCNKRFKDCFQDDRISVNATVANGSHPYLTVAMGDGALYQMESLLSITHTYNRHGQFIIHITAYNNVSRENVTHSLTILEVEKIEGLKVECNRTVILSNVTFCEISLVQGTAFECVLVFGDAKDSFHYNHETLPRNVSHKYTAYGTYMVEMTCNNSLGTSFAKYKTVVTGPELGLSLSNNGPLTVNDLAVITMRVKNPAPKSCFLLDLGDGNKIAYGDKNCSGKYYGMEKTLQLTKLMHYNHTYKTVGVYDTRFQGTDGLLKESATVLIAITASPCRIVKVLLEDVASSLESATRILKSRQFVVRSKYTVNCNSAVGAILRWKIEKYQSGSFVEYNVVTTTTSSMVIEARSLDYGIYKIELTLKLNGVKGILESTEGFLEVTKTPLSATIIQGSAIRRTWNEPIRLDGSESHDPDIAGKSNSRLIFRWFCYDINTTIDDIEKTPLSSIKKVVKPKNLSERISCGRYRKHFSSNVDKTIELHPDLLLENQIILVEMEIEEGNRQARASVLIQRVKSTVPSLTITCKGNCQEKVNLEDVTSYLGECTNHCSSNITKVWSLFEYDKNTDSWKLVENLESKVLTEIHSYSLVINSKVLKGGRRYVVRLSAWDTRGGEKGFTEQDFTTSTPPYGGSCNVTPSEGIALETRFYIHCQNWTLEKEPGTYKFAFQDVYVDLRDILYISKKESAVLKLPAGHPSKNSTLELVVVISDYYGLYTEVSIPTQVLPKKLNNTEISDMILKEGSQLDFLISIGDVQSASELVSGLVSIFNFEASQTSTYNETASRREARSSIIIKLSKVPTLTLEAVKQISVSIAGAAQIKEEVQVEAQVVGTDKIDEMAKYVLNRSLDDVGFSSITDAAKDLVSAGSNVMWSAAYTTRYERTDVSEVEKKKSQEVVDKNMKTFEYSIQAIFNKKLPGQEDTIVQTTSTGLSCRRIIPGSVGKQPMAIKEAQVQFPKADVLLKDVNSTFVDISMLLIPQNPYTWDKTSTRIKSSVVKLNIKNNMGETLKIENLQEDIEIVVSDVEEPITEYPPEYFKEADNSSMQYHTIQHTQEGGSIKLGIRPVNASDSVVAYVKYSSRPTLTDYDMKAIFPNYSSCSINEDLVPFNCSENPFQLVLPSDFLAHTGNYFVGISYSDQNSALEEVKSRQRRDCGSGRRVKRSCIKYKEPPSPLPGNGVYKAFEREFNKLTDRNYTMDTMNVGCSYWDEAASTWTTEGCKVGRRKQSSRKLTCRCSHLTSFGGSLFVAPNPIDLDKVWIGFLNPKDNIAVYITLATVFLIYILAVIWGRRADKREIQSREGLIVLGHDTAGKTYNYLITINTGHGRQAGTTANVSLLIMGEQGTSGVIPISELTKARFNRGCQTKTTVCGPSKLGPLVYIHIWHDNSGDSPAWYLDSVNIRDIQTGEEWNFVCDKWMAVESEDGQTDALIYVANPQEFNSYKRIFISKTSRDLYDGHLWFSVARKPPTSHFTRVQRCSCCLSLLFCTMMTNCMFYNLGNETDGSVLIIGPFKVSVRVLVIGIQSSLIVFPVNLLITFLFRRSTRSGDPKKPLFSLRKLKPGPFMHLYAECCKNKNTRRNKFLALFSDRNLYYLAWVLCILTIATSCTVTLMYTLQWEKQTSEKWLISFITSFFQDALITQPIKIAVLAALLAYIIKERKVRKKSQYKPLRNTTEAELISLDMQSDFSSSDINPKFSSKPPDKKALQKARRSRVKQINTYNVIKDVVWYILFLFLLMTYAFGHMDPLSYELTREIGNLFRPRLEKNRISSYWKWLSKTVVPNLFAGDWYNDRPPGKNEEDLISNRAAVLVGMARLRQIRVKEQTEDIPPIVTQTIYGPYSTSSEDTDFYQRGWKPLENGMTKENVTLDICPLHWRYQDALTLGGMPFWGRAHLYPGGGYVAELGYFPQKALSVILELMRSNWLDRRTRAVFLEFSIYNAQENLFSIATILLEFLPTGGYLPYSRVDTLRVYRYLSSYSDILKATEIIIALVIFVLFYRVVKRAYGIGRRFFRRFWNWVDMLQVFFGFLSVVLYFAKMVILNKTMDALEENPFVFVNFQYTLLLNEIDGYFVAAVVFLTTIKFLRLLKYQSYIKLLEHVFSSFAFIMSRFMIEFTLWFTPFVINIYLIFGSNVENFSSFVTTFESTLNTLLGAHLFYSLQETDRIMGPIIFITFNMLMGFLLLNIFVAIITTSFDRAPDDEFTKETEPELMMFFNEQISGIFGFDLKRTKPSDPIDIQDDVNTIKAVQKQDTISNSTLVTNVAVADSPVHQSDYSRNNKDLKDKVDRLYYFASRVLAMEKREDRIYDLLILRKGHGTVNDRFDRIMKHYVENQK